MSIRITRQLIMPFLFIFPAASFSVPAPHPVSVPWAGWAFRPPGLFLRPVSYFCQFPFRIPDSTITQYHIAMNVTVCQYIFVNLKQFE